MERRFVREGGLMRMLNLKDDGEKREDGKEFFWGTSRFWLWFCEHLTMIFMD